MLHVTRDTQFMSTAFENLVCENPNGMNQNDAQINYEKMPLTYKKCVKKNIFINFFSFSSMESILWHDYEAGGTDATQVPPMQYAAIRTDVDMNIIDEPTDILCKLHGDKIPHPVAIKITGISPMNCLENGLAEPLFFRVIHKEMSVAKTCTTGYNSMGYDETISRFGFWRSLLPVYSREFTNGNTRWDLLPVTAAFSSLKVKGLIWPDVDGKRSLRLEEVAKANGIEQEHAHDALCDVRALIDWSKKLKSASLMLWNELYSCRRKNMIIPRTRKGTVVLHCKAGYGHSKKYVEPLLMLGGLSSDKNKAIGIKLRDVDALRELWKVNSSTVRERLYMKTDELDSLGFKRPPIEIFAVNKTVAIMTLPWVAQQPDLELPNDINIEELNVLSKKIMGNQLFIDKLIESVDVDSFDDKTDIPADIALYSSGFPSKKDQNNITLLSGRSIKLAFSSPLEWDNSVYHTLWVIARCKLFINNGVLTDKEITKWELYRLHSITTKIVNKKHDFVNLDSAISALEMADLPAELEKDYRGFLKKIEK